jgi:rhodanese-related sulfurtransferase
MNTITPVELQKLIAANSDLTLLDVRTPMEFAEVHVPQARNLPLDKLDAATLSDVKAKPIYLLCRSGQRATKAANQLTAAGFQPTVVSGGTLAWIDAGLPVERGTPKAISLERQVRIAAGALVLIGLALGWWVHRGFLGLSAFVGAGLIFAGVTDFCGMGLLLAKMPWNNRT